MTLVTGAAASQTWAVLSQIAKERVLLVPLHAQEDRPAAPGSSGQRGNAGTRQRELSLLARAELRLGAASQKYAAERFSARPRTVLFI